MQTFDELIISGILLEVINSDPFFLESLKEILKKEGKWNQEVKRNLEFIIGNYDKDFTQEYLNLCRSIYQKVLDWILKNNILHFNQNWLVSQFFAHEEFKLSEDSFWPITVYIAANPDEFNDYASIGILLYQNGKVEMFEGNDEATPETIQLVNQLMGAKNIVKQVWSNQPQEVINQLGNGIAPIGIYCSPHKPHAEAYWAEGRSLCTFKISLDHVSQESELDWKVITNAHITNVRIF